MKISWNNAIFMQVVRGFISTNMFDDVYSYKNFPMSSSVLTINNQLRIRKNTNESKKASDKVETSNEKNFETSKNNEYFSYDL